MTLHLPIWGQNYRRPGTFLLCLLAPLFLHTNAAAQDVAEAARQQQAHKSQQPAKPHHVYTDEDLKREHILTPEDQKLAEAHRKDGTAPTAVENGPVEATNPPAESLGEIARRNREQKAAREAAVAAGKTPSQFRIEIPGEALAEPKGMVGPLLVPPSAMAPLVVAPAAGPSRRAGVPARVSPFQPRPMVTPRVSPTPSASGSASTAASVGPKVTPPTVVPRENLQQLRVQPGDSWWRMARRYLGSGDRWQELLALNPGLAEHPDVLEAGSTVVVPGSVELKRAPKAPTTITVRAGDTLWSLARAHFGHGTDWPKIAQANPQVSDYLHLEVGSLLQVPPR
jgi:nucleoid-associated protein YgaU